VGPAEENGLGGKRETLALLNLLVTGQASAGWSSEQAMA